MIGITEEAGKVGTAAMGAMASTPLAIALLLVNVGFLGFAGYVLGEVAEGARTRNATQMEVDIELGARHSRLPSGAQAADQLHRLSAERHPMKMTAPGRKLLMEREGCKLKAYKDSVGVLTIGVGHTSAAGPPPVRAGMSITKTQAEHIFQDDVVEFEDRRVTLLLARRPIEAAPVRCVRLAGLQHRVGWFCRFDRAQEVPGGRARQGCRSHPPVEQARRDQGAAARRAPAVPQYPTCGEGLIMCGFGIGTIFQVAIFVIVVLVVLALLRVLLGDIFASITASPYWNIIQIVIGGVVAILILLFLWRLAECAGLFGRVGLALTGLA